MWKPRSSSELSHSSNAVAALRSNRCHYSRDALPSAAYRRKSHRRSSATRQGHGDADAGIAVRPSKALRKPGAEQSGCGCVRTAVGECHFGSNMKLRLTGGSILMSCSQLKRLPTSQFIGPVEDLKADVDGQPVEPNPRRNCGRHSVDVSPSPEQCLAHSFLNPIRTTKHEHTKLIEPRPVSRSKTAERPLVPNSCRLEALALVGCVHRSQGQELEAALSIRLNTQNCAVSVGSRNASMPMM